MSRSHATGDALELAAALENQGRALLAHAARLREIAGQNVLGVANSSMPVNGTTGDTWLDAAAVIERTGLSRGQVYRLARQGGLGAVRCGSRSFRFSARGLIQWAESGGSR